MSTNKIISVYVSHKRDNKATYIYSGEHLLRYIRYLLRLENISVYQHSRMGVEIRAAYFSTVSKSLKQNKSTKSLSDVGHFYSISGSMLFIGL